MKQKEMLLKEVDHRIKNSLQIVSSILKLQAPNAQSADAASELTNAAARVSAIAAVHKQLYSGDDADVVGLGSFLTDLCQDIGLAHGCEGDVQTDIDCVDVRADAAIPLALIVSELVTNAVKYGVPPCVVTLRAEDGNIRLLVADAGSGPPEANSRTGLGTLLVETFSTKLAARTEARHDASGYQVELTIPLSGER